jgi:copper chaperone CopZ
MPLHSPHNQGKKSMRHFLASVAVFALVGSLSSEARADKVSVSGTHLCCPQCEKSAKDCLSKVDGVSDVKTVAKEKSITFTAKDEKTAADGVRALFAAGFYGSAKSDGKELKVETQEVKKGNVSDTVTVKDVHVCCRSCKDGIGKALKDANATISYEGDGVLKRVMIKGKDLDQAQMLYLLQKAGYHGTVEK